MAFRTGSIKDIFFFSNAFVPLKNPVIVFTKGYLINQCTLGYHPGCHLLVTKSFLLDSQINIGQELDTMLVLCQRTFHHTKATG